MSNLNRCRFAFIALHVVLFFAAFIQGMVELNPLIIFIMGLISGIFLVIYIPPTIVLTLRRKWTFWDMARIEVIYIAFQAILWILLAIFGTLSANSWICTGDPRAGGRAFHFDNHEYSGARFCPASRIFMGLAWGCFGILFFWLLFSLVVLRNADHEIGNPWTRSMGAVMEGDKLHKGDLEKGKAAVRDPSPSAETRGVSSDTTNT